MILEDQVCSLELAKKLKSIGFNNPSLFIWEYHDEQCFGVKFIPYAIIPDNRNQFELYPAYTVGELMEYLPPLLFFPQKEQPYNYYWLQLQKRSIDNIRYIGAYVCDSLSAEEIATTFHQVRSEAKAHAKKLADCLAMMMIYILENGLC